MKKFLLLAGATLAAFGALAETPTPKIWENAVFSGVSKDGKYAVSNIYNLMVTITDMSNPEISYTYFDDNEDHGTAGVQNEYMPGFGTCVALDGSVVGNAMIYDVDLAAQTYSVADNAVIFKEGEIIYLPGVDPSLGGTAHAITPDGKAICGIVGNAAFSIDANQIMQVPAVWYRQEDGTYAEPVLLPHPDRDFLGNVPQYVTAIAMSEDGNIIAGTVTSSTGFDVYPILYKRDAQGNWSYSLPHPEFYYPHPEVEIPENPGDCPEMRDFMTDEEYAAYQAALEAWQEAGGNDWEHYPNMQDFLSSEELAAYNAALQQWQTAKEAYDQAVAAATEGGFTFIFNNVVLSADGKYLGLTRQAAGGILLNPGKKVSVKANPFRRAKKTEGEGEVSGEFNTPYIFNTTDDTVKTYAYAEGDLSVTCAGKDGKFVGYKGDVQTVTEALVMSPENGIQTLGEYKPAVNDWIAENMLHPTEVYIYNEETGEYEVAIVDTLISGIPFCTPDMSLITTFVYNNWDNAGALAYSYEFRFPEDSGVQDIAADANGMRVLRDGIININGEANVEVFALDGTRVFNRAAAQGTVSTGLEQGVYIVRATFANGSVKVAKVNF